MLKKVGRDHQGDVCYCNALNPDDKRLYKPKRLTHHLHPLLNQGTINKYPAGQMRALNAENGVGRPPRNK